MTNRERWIVYPLLFLALGAALRDKLTRSISEVDLITGKNLQIDLAQGVIHCRGLKIVDETGKSKIVAATEPYADENAQGTIGVVRTMGPDDRPWVQLSDRLLCREVRVLGANNLPLVVIGGTPVERPGGGVMAAGAISLEGYNGRPVITLETDPSGEAGIIRTGRVSGESDVVLSSSAGGGVISTIDRNRALEISLGHFNPTVSGLMLNNASGQSAPMLPLIQRVPPLPKVGRPPEPTED